MTAHLVDTNVLLRLVDPVHPAQPVVLRAIEMLSRDGHTLHLAVQNCIEFWNVATRPIANNGLGLSLGDTEEALVSIERLFAVLPELPTVYPTWRQIVVSFGVVGVQVHDARLVAVMTANAITHILTFNMAHFTRYAAAGIVVVNPASI